MRPIAPQALAIAPDWAGETAFLVAGGPSAARWCGPDGTLACLRGRRVLAINTSMTTVAPFADMGFFHDERWLREYWRGLGPFAGRLVTCSRAAIAISAPHIAAGVIGADAVLPPLHYVEKASHKLGLASDRRQVAMKSTSVQGGLNLLAHLGVARIITVATDLAAGADGRCHHHAPHPARWGHKPERWDDHVEELRIAACALARRGIEVINTSPTGRLPFWPFRELSACL
jgi:hypothetical protein